MLDNLDAVLLRRTQRIFLIAAIAWGMYAPSFVLYRAPLCAANCLFQCVLGLLLYHQRSRWASEAGRVRVAHLTLGCWSLGMSWNAVLCGAERSVTAPYLACITLFAAMLLGEQATLLWTVIDSFLLLLIWWLGRYVPSEYVFVGPWMALSQVLFLGLIALIAITYDRITRTYIQAVEHSQAELQVARDGAVRISQNMREILDNVTFGFFVLGPDLRIGEQFTRSCVEFFGTEEISGRGLREVLPQLSESEVLSFEMQMEQVFADILPPELSLAQAPQRFVVGGRILRIEGRVLREGASEGGGDGRIKGVLFTVSDVTALEASQEQARQHKLLVELLQDRGSFREFVRETFAALERAQERLGQGDESGCRLLLHTIKGNAGAHGLLRLMAVVHGIESCSRIGADDVTCIRQELRGFLLENRTVLEIDPDDTGREISEVSSEQIDLLSAHVGRLPRGLQRPFREWVAQVQARPARIFLGPVEQMVARIAERSGKQVRVESQGLDSPVDPCLLGGVLQALQHLIRNAVDHGLEPPEERGSKPPCGLLVLDVSRAPDAYIVTVTDDGRGIDTDRLVRKAVGMGLFGAEQGAALSHQEALELIFHEGLSTAETVTEISGRGVGMASVRAEVEARGGRLTIESDRDRGTRFNVIVPIVE